MSDIIILGDHAPVKPSLVSRFKKAADMTGVAVYVVAPLLFAAGMSMPGHGGAALVVPLLAAGGGAVVATAGALASSVLGLVDIFKASKVKRVLRADQNDSEQVGKIKDGMRHFLSKQVFNQSMSVAAYGLAFMMMASTLAAVASRDMRVGAGTIPVAFALTMAGFYFGRRSYGAAVKAATYDAALAEVSRPVSPGINYL